MRRKDLKSWMPVATGIPGQTGGTIFTDTSLPAGENCGDYVGKID